MPLLVLGVVLFTSYNALTDERHADINGVPGELLAGHSMGQSFVARYDDLAGVALQIGTYGWGGKPLPASLVLHLRESPDQSANNLDLATALVPKGTILEGGDNPLHLFSFPPVHGSQDKTYYIEVESPDGKPGEALTVFWWHRPPGGQGNPYAHGTAYRDGKAMQGDLAFSLHYQPLPFEAWAQLGRAISANMPIAVMLMSAMFGLAALVWLALRLPVLLRDQQRMRSWLVRWSLPLALVIAAGNGLIYMLLVPAWQGPDEYAHFGYVALLDKYGLDDGKVQQLQWWNKDRDDALIEAVSASMNRYDFTRLLAGSAAPGAPTNIGLALYFELRQPPTYYWLGAAGLRAARSVGLQADPYQHPENALRVIRAVSVAISLVVVALAWLAGALLSQGKQPGLRLLLPLTVALLPMHAFIASVANNDILAEVAVSALFVSLLLLLRRPTGLRGIGLAAMSVILAGAGIFTKSTALAAAAPLLLMGLLVWVGMLVSLAVEESRVSKLGRQGRGQSTLFVPFVLGAVVLLFGTAAALMLSETQQDEAAGWLSNRATAAHAQRVETTSAHEGTHVMDLGSVGNVAWQPIVAPIYHPALTITFSGWARLAPEAGDVEGPVKVRLVVNEGGKEAGKAEAILQQPGKWQALTSKAAITESAEPITLWLRRESGTGTVQFDDMALQVEGNTRSWDDPVFSPHLVNPSAETGLLALRFPFSRVLPKEARQMAEAALNPQPFNKRALIQYYMDTEYRSFWGIFGWVAVPLPPVLYNLLGIIALSALAGLAWLGVRRLPLWTWTEWTAVTALISLAGAIVISWAQQMAQLATQGNAAYPQGRYLFVLIIPIVWLLMSGVGGVYTPVVNGISRLRRQVHNPDRQIEEAGAEVQDEERLAAASHVGAWLWVNAVALFAAYSLLSLIAPYYYGGG